MKHKVSELEGALLDAAVSVAEGKIRDRDFSIERGQYLRYSTDWLHGGPIIERERIELWNGAGVWYAWLPGLNARPTGPTTLIAAMRAYVASKLGDEVEL